MLKTLTPPEVLPSFTALDFETANGYRWSICQVGLVRVVNGVITDKVSMLVQPPGNYYWQHFIEIHGITPEMTCDAPTFDKVWPAIKPFICNEDVVAHNAAFDVGCLHQTLAHYGIEMPLFHNHCTYRLYNKSLRSLCAAYHIELNHHDALSDAMACAALFLMYLKKESERKRGIRDKER